MLHTAELIVIIMHSITIQDSDELDIKKMTEAVSCSTLAIPVDYEIIFPS